MNIDSPYFNLQEFVCPHVFTKYGIFAWNFLDPRLVELMNVIRAKIGKAIYVNNWADGGNYDERGLRCIQCSIVKKKIEENELYMSGHLLAKANDFEVLGLLAEEVREWLIIHKNWWPYSFRLEGKVSWVHLDLYNNTDNKIILFNT